jgi:hypothetical protein
MMNRGLSTMRSYLRIAVTSVTMGHDFEVVWVCDEAEWTSA